MKGGVIHYTLYAYELSEQKSHAIPMIVTSQYRFDENVTGKELDVTLPPTKQKRVRWYSAVAAPSGRSVINAFDDDDDEFEEDDDFQRWRDDYVYADETKLVIQADFKKYKVHGKRVAVLYNLEGDMAADGVSQRWFSGTVLQWKTFPWIGERKEGNFGDIQHRNCLFRSMAGLRK